MDDDHKPVMGLGKEDFALKDGGARQPVISVEPATGPIAVGLIFWGPMMYSDAFGHALMDANPGGRVIDTKSVPSTNPPKESVRQAVEGMARELGAAKGVERRAIVVTMTAAAPDDQLQPVASLTRILQENDSPLWTIELGAAGPAPSVDAAVAVGGGYRWRVKTGDELADAEAGVAALLGTAQYFVTANLPSIFTPPAPIATRHDRGIVLVPMWPR